MRPKNGEVKTPLRASKFVRLNKLLKRMFVANLYLPFPFWSFLPMAKVRLRFKFIFISDGFVPEFRGKLPLIVFTMSEPKRV